MNNAVIGQDTLLKEIRRILEIHTRSGGTIRPHFFLTGASGTGKSKVISYVCSEFKTQFLEINAAQLTKEGTSGNSLSKALSPLATLSTKPAVVFVDEFDKLFISGNSNTDLAHETTNGVQNEFLRVLESATTSVYGDYAKYVSARVSNCLFVFAGAFNGEKDITIDRLRDFGIKTEFLGRVGLVFTTDELTLEALKIILESSELLSNYLDLFEEVDREDVISEIMAHLESIYHNNSLGARVVNTLIHQYFVKGGLNTEEANKITFQSKIKFGE